jgi:hypothetical protein
VAGAVLLRSSVPVTAALTVPGGPGGAPSVMTAAAPALQQQGVLADVARRADGTLVLSAPGAAVRVRLTAGVSGLISGGGPAGRAGSPGSTGSSGGAGGSSSAGASGGAASAGGAADAGGGAVTRLVSVKARHSVTVRLAAPRGAHWGPGFAVVLTPLPGSGPLYAGGVLARGGTVLTIIPVASALTRVWMPSVRDSLSTAPPAS